MISQKTTGRSILKTESSIGSSGSIELLPDYYLDQIYNTDNIVIEYMDIMV